MQVIFILNNKQKRSFLNIKIFCYVISIISDKKLRIMPAPYVMPNSSGMDVPSVIQKLIELERFPLKRLEEDNKRNEIRIQAWEELRIKTKKLLDISKDIYSFTGPFAQKKLFSSDEKSITGVASPNVKDVNHQIKVLELAKKHKIRSRELENNEQIPAGQFSILYNTKEIALDFKGGNILELEKLLKEKVGDLFDVSLVSIGNNKFILVLASRIMGQKGKFEFKDPDKILQFLEIIASKGKVQEKKYEIDFKKENFEFCENIEIQEKKVKLLEDAKECIYRPLLKNKINFIEFEINYEVRKNLENSEKEKQKIYIGPEIKNKINDIELTAPNIEREKFFDLETNLENKMPKLGIFVFYYSVLGTPKVKQIPIEFNKRNYQFSLKDLGESEPIVLNSIKFIKEIQGNLEVKKLILNKLEEDEIVFEPLHEIEKAQNSKLLVNGIPVEKDTNENITDIIPGVSLNLHNTTEHYVELKIEYDIQKILEKIREWVKSYNELLTFIKDNDKFNRDQDFQFQRSANPNERIEDGIRKLEDSSGIFAGDPVVRRMVSILNTITGSSYPTKSNIRTLAQIGISTGKPGSAWQDIKKGLLIIDEEKLQESLKNHSESVKELFALDKNEDLIIDDGVAFKINQELDDYVKASGGIISSRIELLKEKIKENKKIIFNKELSLGRKEEMLRQKFGRMETMIENSKSVNKFLQNKLGIKEE